jgi:hypothetical protein
MVAVFVALQLGGLALALVALFMELHFGVLAAGVLAFLLGGHLRRERMARGPG